MKKIIVLSANSKYLAQVITAVKSICFHNKNIRFYLMNRDIPDFFFDELNEKLYPIHSEIIDIKITNKDILNYHTYPHINSDSTFFRYFIPEFILEDKVLYLDSDLIVTADLSPLFSLNLEEYWLAAAEDTLFARLNPLQRNFNAGVMLINNKLWKENNITSHLLHVSNQYINQVTDADQSILNMVFDKVWLELPSTFNYLVGSDYMYYKINQPQYIEDLGDKIPSIIHYNTEAKPWISDYKTRFRHLYWYYCFLDWKQIYDNHL